MKINIKPATVYPYVAGYQFGKALTKMDPTRVVVIKVQTQYGCLGFLGDVFMFFLTCGLWSIWIFVREMRRRRV